jgi:long-chain acyl-CoA synthetase
VLPPFHIYALSVNMMLGIRAAAELILHARFDAEAALKEISARR